MKKNNPCFQNSLKLLKGEGLLGWIRCSGSDKSVVFLMDVNHCFIADLMNYQSCLDWRGGLVGCVSNTAAPVMVYNVQSVMFKLHCYVGVSIAIALENISADTPGSENSTGQHIFPHI